VISPDAIAIAPRSLSAVWLLRSFSTVSPATRLREPCLLLDYVLRFFAVREPEL
jgi:hypothetical protein